MRLEAAVNFGLPASMWFEPDRQAVLRDRVMATI